MKKQQKIELNKLLRKIVSLRDGYKCLKCGNNYRLHLSHIYPKGKYRKMEFEPDNVKFLCIKDHLFWWHVNPLEAAEWLKGVLDQKRLKKLKEMKNTIIKKRLIFKEIRNNLQSIIKELESNVE